MSLTSRLEPLFWMLFGAGAMVAAMVLPALFAIMVFGFPLGWFGTPAETFERLRTLLDNPVAKIGLGAAISLVFWHSAHHLRHFAYDVGLHHLAGAVAFTLYGLAAVGTLVAFGVLHGL